MSADISFVSTRRRMAPGRVDLTAGGERRLDIPVHAGIDGSVEAGRAWERCVWRAARGLIAECPAPRLSARLEATLRGVAVRIARDRGWRGIGTVVFSLDVGTGMFRMIEARLCGLQQGGPAADAASGGHALEVRISACADSGRRGAHLLTYGATRGEALRRAYQALAKLPGLAQADRAFLMDRIASPAFCSGLTGSQLDRIAS